MPTYIVMAWPEETMRRLELMAESHNVLPWPENAGHTIRIKGGKLRNQRS